ncbi:hypothetical protein Vretimale_9731, partial [Volvox reticuliferus]
HRSGWSLQLPPWFGGNAAKPQATATAIAATATAATATATAATGRSGDSPPPSATMASSLSSGCLVTAAAIPLDANEEASLRLALPLMLQRQSVSQQPSSGRGASSDLGGSRQLWYKSAEASANSNSNNPLENNISLRNINSISIINNNNISNVNSNANISNTAVNSRSLILMRARNSTRSSAGTPTPPLTGLIATFRFSGDGAGEVGGGGG